MDPNKDKQFNIFGFNTTDKNKQENNAQGPNFNPFQQNTGQFQQNTNPFLQNQQAGTGDNKFNLSFQPPYSAGASLPAQNNLPLQQGPFSAKTFSTQSPSLEKKEPNFLGGLQNNFAMNSQQTGLTNPFKTSQASNTNPFSSMMQSSQGNSTSGVNTTSNVLGNAIDNAFSTNSQTVNNTAINPFGTTGNALGNTFSNTNQATTNAFGIGNTGGVATTSTPLRLNLNSTTNAASNPFGSTQGFNSTTTGLNFGQSQPTSTILGTSTTSNFPTSYQSENKATTSFAGIGNTQLPANNISNMINQTSSVVAPNTNLLTAQNQTTNTQSTTAAPFFTSQSFTTQPPNLNTIPPISETKPTEFKPNMFSSTLQQPSIQARSETANQTATSYNSGLSTEIPLNFRNKSYNEILKDMIGKLTSNYNLFKEIAKEVYKCDEKIIKARNNYCLVYKKLDEEEKKISEMEESIAFFNLWITDYKKNNKIEDSSKENGDLLLAIRLVENVTDKFHCELNNLKDEEDEVMCLINENMNLIKNLEEDLLYMERINEK